MDGNRSTAIERTRKVEPIDTSGIACEVNARRRQQQEVSHSSVSHDTCEVRRPVDVGANPIPPLKNAYVGTCPRVAPTSAWGDCRVRQFTRVALCCTHERVG